MVGLAKPGPYRDCVSRFTERPKCWMGGAIQRQISYKGWIEAYLDLYRGRVPLLD